MKATTFSELNLLSPLQRALAEEGYLTPTPIQRESIPHLLAGRDLLGCAQTGTGKTAAFALPVLHRIGDNPGKSIPGTPRALVLAPTRELADQIGESFRTYGRHLKLRQVVIYGGVNQTRQVRMLARGVHVLVATPGRLLDLMQQGHVRLNALDMFILDEADRMLDLGFLPALKKIIAALPRQRQSMFFSATQTPRILELAEGLLTDPVQVTVTPPSSTVDQIEQRVVFLNREQKRQALEQLLRDGTVSRALVFTRTKHGADTVARRLAGQGIQSGAIHGNKTQAARQRILDEFRRNRFQVLVATDVAARGLDIDDITHVVNYDMPYEPESYVHRIGRTGRAGASGVAISFCDHSERGSLRAIERLIGRKVPVDQQNSRTTTTTQATAPTATRPHTPGGPSHTAGQQGKRRPPRRPGPPTYSARRTVRSSR